MQVSRLILQRQVLLTLSYSHVFSKPLSPQEISTRLLSRSSEIVTASDAEVVQALDDLKSRKLVVKHGGYWQINHTGKDLSLIRKKRERLSDLKLKELSLFIRFATLITWIRGVAVTGSVSVQNADAKDDVDLMIVVQTGRLWLVRPLLVLFSFMCGKRRSWNKEEYNSWCLNLWLEETSLAVPRDKRSVYTAYEVCQALWVHSTHDVAQEFFKSNTWVSKYVPKYFIECREKAPFQERTHTFLLFDGFLTACDQLAYILQRIYMKRHMTTERVGLTYAFFHPRDTKGSIFESWKKIITNIS